MRLCVLASWRETLRACAPSVSPREASWRETLCVSARLLGRPGLPGFSRKLKFVRMTNRIGAASRGLMAFLGLVLLLVQGGLEPLHACPVHEPIPAQTQPAGHTHHDSAAQSEAGSNHCCTCLGSCVAPTALAIATTASSPQFVALTSTLARAEDPADLPRAAQPRLLPFATAPPLS